MTVHEFPLEDFKLIVENIKKKPLEVIYEKYKNLLALIVLT